MNPGRRYGKTETPLEQVEPAEFDAAASNGSVPVSSGGFETPVIQLPSLTFDGELPLLVVTVHLEESPENCKPDFLALHIYYLAIALSDYEKSIGGSGLRLLDKVAGTQSVTMHFMPVLEQNATIRLERIVTALPKLTLQDSKPAVENQAGIDVFGKTTDAVGERCRLILAQQHWKIACQIAA